MQTQQRAVIFFNLAHFVEKEGRIATHPVFGDVTGTLKTNIKGKPRSSVSSGQSRASFAMTTEDRTTERSKSCPYSEDKSNHKLENCNSLRKKPYKERIQFLMVKRICFRCLMEEHVAKNCPKSLDSAQKCWPNSCVLMVNKLKFP